MKKEFKRVKKLTKRIIDKESHKKLKKIRSYDDKTEGLKYLISSYYKLKLLELDSKIGEIKKGKESLVLESKFKLLPHKIKIFESSYLKRDFLTLQKLTKEIEDLIQNVWIPKEEKRRR